MEVFDPPVAASTAWFACVQFVLLLGGVSVVLWFANAWSATQTAILSATLLACYWSLGAVLQGRLSLLGALTLECAALATATSALGLHEWHLLFKPLTMLLAVLLAWQQARLAAAPARNAGLLGAALLASLAGDIFLMLSGSEWFIPGLAAFLVAHLLYIALFRIGQPWFPSRGALGATLAVGVAMVALLWNGLADPMLKLAVTAYVTVIALMAAQAIGRALVLRTAPATATLSLPGRPAQVDWTLQP